MGRLKRELDKVTKNLNNTNISRMKFACLKRSDTQVAGSVTNFGMWQKSVTERLK